MVTIVVCLLVIAASLGACVAALWKWGRAPIPVELVEPAEPPRVELCCRCNAEIVGDEIHEIVAVPSDDRAIGVEMGGTYVAADFCADCCLGPDEGCRHPDHARLVA